MMRIHENIEQRTQEWHELRQKYPLTASKAQSIGNQGKGLETIVWEQISAKYSSADKDQYSNEHLERGIELEPQARSLYELETCNKVVEVGFVTNDNISSVAGASPDGLVNEDGLLEIKCFEDVKHFRMTLEDDFEIESQYLWQMQMQMLITERKWCDFVAYNPNYKKSLLIKRVYPDLIMQEKIKTGLAIGEKLIINIESKIK
jgi:putative phage-type endonuclease